MSTNLQKYSLPFSSFRPNLVNWSIFPSLTSSPAQRFPPSAPEHRLPLRCSKSSRKGKKVKISLNITTHMHITHSSALLGLEN